MRDGVTRGALLRAIVAGSAVLACGVGTRAAEPDTVIVGGIRLPTNAPLFIAIEKGYFTKQGIQVRLTWFAAAASVFSAVVSGDIDVGVTATTAATFNLAAKGGFRIIAGTLRDEPHFPLNAFLVSDKAYADGFTALAKMGGRRIAMTTAGSSYHYYIGELALKYKVPISSIALVPLENFGNISAALQSGQVDAAMLPPSLAQRVLDAGKAHFLAWTGDEVPTQLGIAVASPHTLASKHDLMRRFMRAYVQGAQAYHRTFDQLDAQGKPVKGPDYPELIGIIARYVGITPQEAAARVAYIIPDLRPDQADIMRQIAFWQQQGMVSRNVDFSRLFDLSLLPATSP